MAAAPADPPPSDNLYMKGLPTSTSEESLRAMFGALGTVVSCKLLPCPPGVDGGAALVRMGSVTEAQWLVDNALQFASGLGAPLTIKFAANGKGCGKGTPPPPPPPQPGVPGQPSTRLYVKGLPLGIAEDHLKAIMSAYGTCVSCKVLPPPPAGAPDSAAIVQMGTTAEAQWLVENVHGNIPQGLAGPVEIKFKTDKDAAPLGAAQLGPFCEAAVEVDGPGGLGPGVPPPPAAPPSENIFVKGLPAGVNEETIGMILGSYGTVTSCTIVPPSGPPSGKSDTACHVRMSTLSEATFLVENLNGNIPHGLTEPVQVWFDGGAKGCGKGCAPAAKQDSLVSTTGQPNDNLYVKGLPDGTNMESLAQIFGAYGTVLSCKVLTSPPGANNVAGLVRMGSVQEAQWLVTNVDGNIPQGLTAPVSIKFANNATSWGGPRVATATPPAGTGGAPCADNLYIKGLPADLTDDSLRAILAAYGTVVACKALSPPPGKMVSAGLIRMGNRQEAQWLVDHMNGNIPAGQTMPVEVRFASQANTVAKGKGKGCGASEAYSPY